MRFVSNVTIKILFFIEVLEKFGLDPTQAASSYLFDQDGFQIPVDLFAVVAPQFVNPSVYFKIVFQLNENSGFDSVYLYPSNFFIMQFL